MITGRDPVDDGIRSVIDGVLTYNDVVGMSASYPNLYRTFRDAGYRTGHFGKWHLGLDPSLTTVNGYGIDEAKGWAFPAPYALVGQEFTTAWGAGSTAEKLYAYGQFDDLATTAAIQFMTDQTTPFFVNLSFHSPHAPVNPPITSLQAVSNLADLYGRSNPAQLYYAAIHRLAYNVDRICTSIGPTVLANTIMIFTADNGGGISHSAVNSADQWGRARNYRGQKGETGNGGVIVPFGIRGPGVPAGLDHSHATVSGLDLPKTLCAMCGVPWVGAGPGEDRSAVFLGTDTDRTGVLHWLSIQGDAATLDRVHRFPAYRGYYPDKQISVYLNLNAQMEIEDLAVYDAGLDPSGIPVDPAEMQNLILSDGVGDYIQEVDELHSWAIGVGEITWIDPASHGELSPDQ